MFSWIIFPSLEADGQAFRVVVFEMPSWVARLRHGFASTFEPNNCKEGRWLHLTPRAYGVAATSGDSNECDGWGGL